MKATGKCLFFIGLIVSSSVATAQSYRASDVSRAPNLSGLTGLLNMNLPHTMGAGMTAVGGATFADSLPGMYQDYNEVIGALRIGFSDNVELGLKTKSFNVKDLVGNTDTGLGDAEAMIKWKFREQSDSLFAMSLGLGAILPTGDENKGFREVDSLGLKFNVTAAGENALKDDGYIGLYFEGEVVAIDQMSSSSPYKEKYGKFNVGFAFPISDDNNLSFFTEFNQVLKKDIAGVVQNHTAVSPGLRYANDNLSLTVAGQSVNYTDLNTTQNRLIGQLSLGF